MVGTSLMQPLATQTSNQIAGLSHFSATLQDLPFRLTKAEVLKLTRYSSSTLSKRIAEGVMPAAIDRNSQGALFDRSAVLDALGLLQPPERLGEQQGAYLRRLKDVPEREHVASPLAHRKALQATSPRPARTLAALVDAWKATSSWHDLSPKTVIGYQTGIRSLLAWAEANSEPDPSTLNSEMVERYAAAFNARPRSKRNNLDVFRLVMNQAVAKGWRPDNPCRGIRVRLPKSRTLIWEADDVEAYAWAAQSIGRRSIALMIRMEWEIGQRLTDVRTFRSGVEYRPSEGMFRFRQQKTQSHVSVPVSCELQALLNAAGEDTFLFKDESTGKPYAEARLTHVFADVRAAAEESGARSGLVLRWLRHSCVVQLARAGCEIPEIAAITGHSLRSATNILQTYLPRDSQVARNAQIKRGLIRG